MTYALAAALQSTIFQMLIEDVDVKSAVDTAVFDAPPDGKVPDIYVVIGPEDARDVSDATGKLTEHRFSVSVHGKVAGFLALKRTAAAIDAALTSGEIALSEGHLVSLRFLRARARRDGPANGRRVDMTFRAILDDLPN